MYPYTSPVVAIKMLLLDFSVMVDLTTHFK